MVEPAYFVTVMRKYDMPFEHAVRKFLLLRVGLIVE